MKNALRKYFENRKEEEKAKGNVFTQAHLATDIGISTTLLSLILLGKKTLSFRTADLIERNTNGKLSADMLLEESIQWHKKWLERKEKFDKK